MDLNALSIGRKSLFCERVQRNTVQKESWLPEPPFSRALMLHVSSPLEMLHLEVPEATTSLTSQGMTK